VEPRDITAIYAIGVVGHALRLPDLALMTGSRRAALPKSTTFRYLTTPEELGHIEWDVRETINLRVLNQVEVEWT
jgi:DNA-binding IclR family transcriptional regulator